MTRKTGNLAASTQQGFLSSMRVDIPTLPGAELRVPQTFSRLYDIAYNLWWSWDAMNQIWRSISPDLWTQYRNPVEMLSVVDPATWKSLEDSEVFQDQYTDTVRRFDEYMARKDTWWDRHHTDEINGPVAYLCAEYGVHSSMPIYSGGLGVLAGDHTKSASDLGVPFVAVGLLYRRGYFRQEIEAAGDQQHMYPVLDTWRMPVVPVAARSGQLKVEIEFPGRTVLAAVWSMQVGRVPILLLDTDIPENSDADRPITHMLYVRGREMRFVQEYVLGVGAVRSLNALGINPATWHVNEGHAAMSLLERLANEVKSGATLEDAEKAVQANTLFTLHTPVPAGNEVFDMPLVEKYLSEWPHRVGRDMAYLSHLGSTRDGEVGRFDLGALAIRLSSFANGVSQRHATVASNDWGHLLGGDIVHGITNGVHTPSWVSRGNKRLLAEVIGADWLDQLIEDPSVAEKLREVPDKRIWDDHLGRKTLLTRFGRGRMRRQFARHGASPDELRAIDTLLPPDRLTIGFARRFATYKRAVLMFHNIPWLQAILTNPERPAQVVFAGKAHPADKLGQEYIRRIVELSKSPELTGHIYFLEDYDIRMGRFLTQGVDVWLNNPRPPQEASGTSGMKAAMNGGLNLSVLDGWWAEGFNGKNGWAFGLEWGNGDHEAQDNEDALALYRILQDEVVPRFYDRDASGTPLAWVEMMKEAMISTLVGFSTNRMVKQYTEQAYLPLARKLES